jgi:hypothetical protein
MQDSRIPNVSTTKLGQTADESGEMRPRGGKRHKRDAIRGEQREDPPEKRNASAGIFPAAQHDIAQFEVRVLPQRLNQILSLRPGHRDAM